MKFFCLDACGMINDLGKIIASTIDNDNVKSQSQVEEDVLDYQKQLTLLNLNGVETSTNAQDAQE